MASSAISLRDVTKCYLRHAHPRDALKAMLGLGDNAQGFWALRGITLDVPRGETWGIVGRNGSGKSTLLQIIAGTLQCTGGEVSVNGRVSALLELGSGFHPEFTGRENVVFQGLLQGCTRVQIEQKFGRIVDFAGIGDFLDQPVKRYSSGMLLRLAFAVTVALDPDILIVDEALAVGDEAFQRKCFGRIRALREEGCTVLFVSHSGQQIVELCDRAVMLDAGEQLMLGSPKDVISWYHKLIFAPPDRAAQVREEIRAGGRGEGGLADRKAEAGETSSDAGAGAENGTPMAVAPPEQDDDFEPQLTPQSTVAYPSLGAEITGPALFRLDGSRVNVLVRGRRYRYRYQVRFTRGLHRVRFGMMIKTISGLEIGGGTSHARESPLEFVDAGAVCDVAFEFACALQPGVYFANAGVTAIDLNNEIYAHRLVDAVMFRVKPEPHSRVTGIVDFGIESTVDFRR